VTVTEHQVLSALRRVVDPCSRAMGDDLSLVELGMVDGVIVGSDASVTVQLLFDDPLCLYFEMIQRAISEMVGGIEGVTSVRVEQTESELWTEDRMQPAARERLHAARERRRERLRASRPVRINLSPP
jgi:metal-sulfur cluster biosynthetic enzyme